MTTEWIKELLRKQAQEIADEGHAGWGNTMVHAADELEALATLIDEAIAINEESDLGVLGERLDAWAARAREAL